LEDDGRASAARGEKPEGGAERALGMQPYLDQWDKIAKERDTFPSGYFETDDGKLIGLRLVSNVDLGNAQGDELLAATQSIVAALGPTTHYDPAMRIGFTGDIASAADEKHALASQAVGATAFAVAIILVTLIVYYRSPPALLVIGLPVVVGVAAAYAFAEIAFGYVNTSGAFLGAIIVGNGINYP